MELKKLPLFDNHQHWTIEEKGKEKEYWRVFIADNREMLKKEIEEFIFDVQYCEGEQFPFSAALKAEAKEKAINLMVDIEQLKGVSNAA